MESLLDDLDYIAKVDKENMLGAISRFPSDARMTINQIRNLNVPDYFERGFNSLLVIGMGGSAIGGLLLKDWLRGDCNIPIDVSRSYHIPKWVNQKSLVFAVSYSGNTEETLSQLEEAIELGCEIVAFCSGGEIREIAEKNGIPIVLFPEGYKPRAAIASQFYSLAGITHKIGLISDVKWIDVQESIKVVEKHLVTYDKETPIKDNQAKKLAEEIKGYTPFIYGNKLFKTVAYRFCTQFNENSKSPAATNFFPEAFHNSVLASEGIDEILNTICCIFLTDPMEVNPIKNKVKNFRKILNGRFGKIIDVRARGRGELARIMSTINLGDFVSAYLGILYGKDPSEMESIVRLKRESKI
ncbi:bifunctional phosphoglucose/phosphomannose isomerase [Candidatus Bathyarchaeota archaeon]|nr:bifunctional phosphoglucose/phosphomannose isomerase [Candidatus Bathyarchaeota archaeon]